MVQLVKGLDLYPEIEQFVITFSDYVEYQDIYNTRAKIYFIDYKSLNKFQLFRRVQDILYEVKPDIVHSWNGGPIDIILSILKYRLSYKYIAGFVADGNDLLSLSLSSFIYKFSFCTSDAIVSNSVAGLLAKRAPMRKSYVIYNGFDFKRIRKIDVDLKKKELGITSKVVVGMIARVSAAKDYESFIKLAEISHINNDDIQYIAVGGGDMLDYYKGIVETKKITSLHFIGGRSDIEEILQIMDVSVLFSNDNVHREGVSNTILESMASGVPVIVTSGGGTAEIVDDGVNGFIVPPSDVCSVYELIIRLISDPNLSKLISDSAVNTVKSKFTLKLMTAKYYELYSSLLS